MKIIISLVKKINLEYIFYEKIYLDKFLVYFINHLCYNNEQLGGLCYGWRY